MNPSQKKYTMFHIKMKIYKKMSKCKTYSRPGCQERGLLSVWKSLT